MKEIKVIREVIENGNLYLSFEIDNTEICYSSEWGVLELYKGDENLLENNRAVLYSNISEIKKKYESTFDDIQGIYKYELSKEEKRDIFLTDFLNENKEQEKKEIKTIVLDGRTIPLEDSGLPNIEYLSESEKEVVLAYLKKMKEEKK